MRKPKFETPDLTSENIEKIAALFPNCITEMLDEEHSTPEKKVYKRAVNFEMLKQMLSPDVVDGDEAYEFTWVGKKAAIVEANKPIRKTLRPCVAESKDWDATENLYIEGDNLEVLKLLQESYLGKVKMIYIDPPYNTGNDFIYADDFKMESEEWKVESGEWSEEGDRLFKNTDTNGRFHSDWCSMIYSRLMLARNLLTDDGVIFISISDAEVDNLKKICDEVMGAKNYLGDIIWNSTKSVTNTALISVSHTYNLVYFRNIEYFVNHRNEFRLPEKGEGFSNPDNDPRGEWKADPFQVGGWRPNQQYDIVNPKTGVVYKPNPGCSWKNDYVNFQRLLKDNRIVFGSTGEAGPQRKRFIWEAQERGMVAKTIWDDVETTTNGTQLLKKLFGQAGIFDNPKPVEFVKKLLQLGTHETAIVLDFFSGSATTAHAVMQLNAEDGGHRKFIMVQLPEKCDEKSEAYKAGYKNICEIGKERIRRAGEKILKEQLANDNSTLNSPNSKLDIGFRVLKLDSTNMKDVYYAPGDYDQDFLHQLESNIKDDRTDLDLLFGCLIDWGLSLSLPYKFEQIDGCTVHTYNDGDLIACFDANVPESVVKEIAQRKPLRAVFRDSGFASSPEKINMFEIFKLYMPEDAGDITKCVRVI
ncbi:MAG: site-specific DNA-methyltransferase [Christensenellales bacterium]|jgi:adenine-specific DNA-methyltransferase